MICGTTRTVKEQSLVLPEVSFAVQVTTLSPTLKADAEGGEQMTRGLASQLSLAVGAAKLTGAWPEPGGSAATRMSGGQTICGSSRSRTLTVKLHRLSFPVASVATQLTVLSPSGNTAPGGGVQMTWTSPSQMSTAVTLKEAGAPAGPAQESTTFVEQTMCGGVVSASVMVWWHVAVLPQASA